MMIEIDQFAAAIGRKKIAEAVGVLPTAVSNAVVRRRKFPGYWYDTLHQLAEKEGVPCPREMFSWKRP